ncbi:MAG: hypothetical protein A2536_00270 [Candidatus Firestonebacteria bacterium RIFOXYD2_FULL_39_29]|nr:MAG: hypothetical protein A2536_00270 [Candidatus Firestonebacteria bacterium RIFOXYD2_FULL_39_29]
MKSILKVILILLANIIVSTVGITPAAAASIMYSTYLGGTVVDRVNAIALDSSNNVYLVGKTVSTGFPGATGTSYQTNISAGTDAFVTKISSGGVLSWSTYLGGDAIDIANAVAVDNAGIVYIAGSTTSTTFPMKNANIGTYVGSTDTFVTAVSASGAGLVYSTYLGGSGVDIGYGIAVNASTGAAYIVGDTTASAPTAFVTTDNPDGYGSGLLARGASDIFVVEYNPAGGLAHACLLGGTTSDIGRAIAIDGTGKIYITGQTTATFTTTAVCFKSSPTGATDAFVAILSADFASLLYGTYIGGNGNEDAFGIALDPSLNVYIAGYTDSTANFPTTGFGNMVGQTIKGTGEDAFVFKLNAGSAGISDGVYATFIGGDGVDRATAIKVDSLGNAYVIGYTFSTATGFPLNNPILSPDLSTRTGSEMAFVTVIDPSPVAAQLPVFCSYLGGSDGATVTEGWGIGLDSSNNIYAVGYTTSALFPIVSELYTYQGSEDGFLTKISAVAASTVATPVITPAAGLYTGSVTVTITTSTSLATIRYTTDGSAPNGSSAVYTVPFAQTTTATIVAFAMKGGMTDSAATAATAFTIQVATPVITPAAGLYAGSVTVTITTSTSLATIRYTTDGSAPNGSSTVYTVPFVQTSTATIVAFAMKGGMTNSAATAATAFTIEGLIPVITPAAGQYTGSVTITMATGTSGATIRYTTDGTAPNGSSTEYTGPFAQTTTATIVAFTTKGGITSSATATSAFTILSSIISIDPAGGTTDGGTTVTITGLGFTGTTVVTQVKFGSLNATSFIVDSNTQIRAIAPAQIEGAVNIVAMSSVGSSPSVSGDIYTYFIAGTVPVITKLNPVYGPSTGGATVVITGSGFTGVTGANGVKFGNLNAESYVVNSDTKITAKTKAHAVGVVDVVVTNQTGLSLVILADQYNYTLTAPVSGSTSYVYPSPSTGSTVNINYFMDGPGVVKIRVYNAVGRLADSLEESKLDGAQYSTLNIGNLAPGVYFYILSMNYDNGDTSKFTKRKFVVVR